MTEGYVWLITGANRGIGLETVTQLLRSPSITVLAACRNPAKATELQALIEEAGGRLHLVALDITDKESVTKAAKEVANLLRGKGVDYLVNNAAILPGGLGDTAFGMDIDDLATTFATNVAGTAYVTQAFVGLVERSTKKTVVNISSTVGSIGFDFDATGASYAVSKAALNMLTYKQAKEKPEVTTISLCPGWLQTGELQSEMGGPNATHPVSVGVEGVLKVILSLKPEDSGQFFNFKGERVPW
ncbi:NAD(P)-binding protein [Polyporus arcularius HHB13444]|uniref:NAD(P)-binding protein n=1 Tax=Polyporus arcularius HHB13444 TaxID=1314778 RepID=A0A5C3PEI3_9APHY|nr:NAD(P)-binding protein [Polyporus arcularius HHB13444]